MTFNETLNCLSSTDQQMVGQILSLFEGVDTQTQTFCQETGLRCQKGCGDCCTAETIETTLTEALPLAVYLWSKDLAQQALDAIEARPVHETCIFYRPEGLNNGEGFCSVYPYRFGVCRLFSFAARKDKYGSLGLVTCKHIKENQTQEYKEVEQKLQKKDAKAPMLSAYALSVASIDPVHGQMLLPVNQAVKQAIEKVGFYISKH
ncbi:MAG: YkgJ family cysteine cluster protein [Candidatus Omnitrophica bacterium]|nr:YkgJ family cysteine cluster protein [Candidatus Omnitrophota bacterium]